MVCRNGTQLRDHNQHPKSLSHEALPGRIANLDLWTAAARPEGFRFYLRGIVADAVQTLQEATSPSSHTPSDASVKTGIASPSMNDMET